MSSVWGRVPEESTLIFVVIRIFLQHSLGWVRVDSHAKSLVDSIQCQLVMDRWMDGLTVTEYAMLT